MTSRPRLGGFLGREFALQDFARALKGFESDRLTLLARLPQQATGRGHADTSPGQVNLTDVGGFQEGADVGRDLGHTRSLAPDDGKSTC